MTNMDNHPKVCRLCLDVISNPNFEALDAVKLAMLKILPLNINPAYTINALICSQCSDKLQHIFHFKMACLDNNDYIKTFLHCDSGFMVVLEETIVRNLSIQDGIKHEEEKVCRFCLKYFDIGQLTKLNGLEEDIFMKDMLEKCLPEINLNITKDPSVCQECTDMLQNQFNFVINCLDVDERIQNFLSSGTNNNDDRLDLSVVLKFDSTQLNGEDDYDIKDISQFVVKKEEIFEDPGESHFQCKVEENLESNLELETIPEECIKLEENIKSDSDSEESLPNSPGQPEQPSFPEAEMLERNADGMFVCTVCPHQTNRRDSLVTHFLTHKKKAEREFKCEECQFVTNYKTSLRLHVQLHKDPTELELFYCAECSYKSMYKKHVRRHGKRHMASSSSKKRMKSDSSVKMYRCQFCSLTSEDKVYFKQHNKIEHDKNIVLVDECEKCEICDYKPKNLRNLLNHKRLAHKIAKGEPAKNYVCEWCGYRTNNLWHLQDHSLKHKSCDDIEMFKCLHCSFQTKYKNSLCLHLKRHDSRGKPKKGKRTAKSGNSEYPRQPEEPSFPEAEMLEKNADGMFVCTVCPHQTNRRDSLVKHFSTHRKKPEQPSFPDAEMLTKNADGMFVCTVCPHQTNRRDSLVKHFLTHKKKAEREFKCEECKFVSTYKTSLRLHALLHKDPTELELFYCAECSYKSMHKKHVRRHYKRHTKSSSSKSRMKSDSSVKLYRCQFCSLTSKDKLYFKQHNKIEHDKHIVLVDESGRCEKCEECDYKSKNLRNLLNHMRLTHKIVKNFQPAKKYVCEWCGYRTHKMWNYQEHSLQHKSCDDIEMFKCLHCPFQTKYKSSLRSHLKRHEFGGKPQKENRTAKRGASK